MEEGVAEAVEQAEGRMEAAMPETEEDIGRKVGAGDGEAAFEACAPCCSRSTGQTEVF